MNNADQELSTNMSYFNGAGGASPLKSLADVVYASEYNFVRNNCADHCNIYDDEDEIERLFFSSFSVAALKAFAFDVRRLNHIHQQVYLGGEAIKISAKKQDISTPNG